MAGETTNADSPTHASPLYRAVLSRVRDFLPAMESANKSLEEALRERPASEFDIENVADDTEHIEMVRAIALVG